MKQKIKVFYTAIDILSGQGKVGQVELFCIPNFFRGEGIALKKIKYNSSEKIIYSILVGEDAELEKKCMETKEVQTELELEYTEYDNLRNLAKTYFQYKAFLRDRMIGLTKSVTKQE